MHKLRPSTGLVRAAHVLTFASALAALTGFVVADVIAAEAEQPTALAIRGAPELDPLLPAPAPELLAMAIVVPDAAAPEPAPPPVTEKPRKPHRKIKFGRFDSY